MIDNHRHWWHKENIVPRFTRTMCPTPTYLRILFRRIDDNAPIGEYVKAVETDMEENPERYPQSATETVEAYMRIMQNESADTEGADASQMESAST